LRKSLAPSTHIPTDLSSRQDDRVNIVKKRVKMSSGLPWLVKAKMTSMIDKFGK